MFCCVLRENTLMYQTMENIKKSNFSVNDVKDKKRFSIQNFNPFQRLLDMENTSRIIIPPGQSASTSPYVDFLFGD